MIRAIVRTGDGQFRTGLQPEEFAETLSRPNTLLWVDFEAEPPAVCEPILRNTFGFHPLAVEDALQQAHVPKVDDWGDYLYVVIHALDFDAGRDPQLLTGELDVFLGKHYLVTHHDHPIPALQHAWESCQRDERHLKRGPDHLLYRIADELVLGYMPVIDEIDEAINDIEDEIFGRAGHDILPRVFMLKRALLTMRRIIDPQREVMNKLARDTYAVIDAKDRVFFRDLYDHLVRLHDINESMRDLVSGALDTYLSVVSNRMNEVMKTLTVITTLFMPLSFLVGFFGMNFFQAAPPHLAWTSNPVFNLTLATMVMLPVLMFLWVRQRRWM